MKRISQVFSYKKWTLLIRPSNEIYIWIQCNLRRHWYVFIRLTRNGIKNTYLMSTLTISSNKIFFQEVHIHEKLIYLAQCLVLNAHVSKDHAIHLDWTYVRTWAYYGSILDRKNTKSNFSGLFWVKST